MTTLERAPSAPSSIESNALLKDLYEKKQNLRRIASEVGSMASELRDVRTRMATQESHLEQETSRRQAAEAKAKTMERELEFMHKSLEEKNAHAISTAAVAEQYLRELVDVRARLESFQGTADLKAASAVTAQSQCKTLLEELEMKTEALIEQEAFAKKLSQQLLDLQQELQLREGSQMHLKEEVERMETEMKSAVAKITSRKESELKGSLGDLNMKNSEHLVKYLSLKDEEIARQREELRSLSAHLKMKARDVEAQMDKHRTADQDLKKRVVKLEFWLQEARTQARKLQRVRDALSRSRLLLLQGSFLFLWCCLLLLSCILLQLLQVVPAPSVFPQFLVASSSNCFFCSWCGVIGWANVLKQARSDGPCEEFKVLHCDIAGYPCGNGVWQISVVCIAASH